MKLSESGAEVARGVAALEERKRLAANAENVKIARCEKLAGAADCQYDAAVAILEMITADPAAYGIVVDDRSSVRTKPVKQTPGMIRNIETNMRDLLLAFESLSKVLPTDDRERLRDPVYHAIEALEMMGRPSAEATG